MTELSGTLEGVGLPAILRFLSGLQKTGTLRITQDDWRGDISLERGQVTGARLGSREGRPALDAMLQVLPHGRFSFDVVESGGTIQNVNGLSANALQSHLAEVASQIALGHSPLPSPDAVPTLPAQESSSAGEQSLALDRATLQTLLAIDGERTVGEIVAQQRSLEAWFQLDRLAELGVIDLNSGGPAASTLAQANSDTRVAPSRSNGGVARPDTQTQPEMLRASVHQLRAERQWDEPGAARVADQDRALNVETAPQAEAVTHCPKLGFEDDTGNSLGRPTRMHRCFAAELPLPLSLDQQRELCLTEEYGICPRFTSVGALAATHRDVQAEAVAPPMARRASPSRADLESEDPGIVHWPVANNPEMLERGGVADRQASSASSEPTRLRPPLTTTGYGAASRNGSTAPPTPLRARIEQARSAESTTAPSERVAGPRLQPKRTPESGPRPDSKRTPESTATPESPLESQTTLVSRPGESTAWSGDRAAVAGMDLPERIAVDKPTLLAALPRRGIAAATLVVLVLALVWYLALGRPSGSELSRSNDGPASGSAAIVAPAAQPDAGAAGGVPPSAAQPTSAATQSSAPAGQPVAAPQPAGAPARAPVAVATAAAPPVSAATTLLDERFVNNDRNWPSAAQGAAFVANGAYRLTPRQAGQFVAIGAPIANAFTDVVVNATFHKLGGPSGGGYGIIVRDQAAVPENGTSQTGNYYVLEAGDNGEIGIWRRDGDRWTDLRTWRAEPAVKPGTATNELSVRAVGNRLTFAVNGTEVASTTDNTYQSGGVGLFVGGDGNEVSVDRFTIFRP